MIIDLLKEGLEGGSREGRACLITAILLSISIYLSSMSWIVSAAVVVFASVVTRGKSLRLLAGFLPFYLLFGVSAIFTGVYALKALFAFFALISAGSVIYSTSISEIAGALLFFRIPGRIVSVVMLAISMLPLLLEDFLIVKDLHEGGGFSRYYALLKAFVSTAILRSISLSESLYSKNFVYKAFGKSRMPDGKDLAMLIASTAIFLVSLLGNIP